MLARWRPVLAYTVVELAIPWLLLSRAEQHLSSSFSALMIATVPLLGVLLARATGGTEHIGRRRLLGLGLGLAGVATLVGAGSHGATPVTVGEELVVAMGYATGPWIINRHLSDLPSLGVVAVSLTVTAVLYAPAGLVQRPSHVSGQVLAAVVVLALVCTALAFLLFFDLITEVGPSRATVITYVNPAVAVLLGVVLLGESLTVGVLIGFPLILAGSVLATGGAPGRAVAEP